MVVSLERSAFINPISSQIVHRTGNTQYPSFGEKIRGPNIPSWIKVASKICIIVASCLSVIGIIPLVIWALRKTVYKHRLKRSLPAQAKNEEAPQVGRYYKADIHVAKIADDGFEWKKNLIHSAETSIELSANYAGGKEFRDILGLIEERLQAKTHLRVHLLLNPEMLEPEDKEKLKKIQAMHSDRFTYLIHAPQIYMDGGIHTEENHVKVLVVDEKYFVMGGTSIHPRLSRETQADRPDVKAPKSSMARVLDPSSRDNDIVGESENIAKVMRGQFYNLLQICEMHVLNKPVESRFFDFVGQKGACEAFQEQPAIKEARLKVIVGGPEHRIDNPITRQYVKRIEKAKSSIVLANMQFYPHERIQSALKKNKGASITLLTGGASDLSCIGRCCQVWRSRINYAIPNEVFEYQIPRQEYHKKIAVFDAKHTLIGSYNLGRKSSFYDHEMICVIKDERVAHAFKEVIDEDKGRSKEVRSSILKHPMWHTILGSLLRPFEQFV